MSEAARTIGSALASWCKKHISDILTVASLAGSGAAVYTAYKNGPKAAEALYNAEAKKGAPLTFKERMGAEGKYLILPGALYVTASACEIVAHVKDGNLAKASASAAAMLAGSYAAFRKGTDKVYGPGAAARVDLEIGQVSDDHTIWHYTPFSATESIADIQGKVLFYDFFTKKYFISTTAHVLDAQKSYLLEQYSGKELALIEYYDLLGITQMFNKDEIELLKQLGLWYDIVVDNLDDYYVDFINSRYTKPENIDIRAFGVDLNEIPPENRDICIHTELTFPPSIVSKDFTYYRIMSDIDDDGKEFATSAGIAAGN